MAPADLAETCRMVWDTLSAAPPALPMRGMPNKLVLGPIK